MNKIFVAAAVLALLFGTASCRKNKRFVLSDAEISDTSYNVKIIRFDSAMLAMDTVNPADGIRKLYRDFPDFMPYYLINILDEDPSDTAKIENLFGNFLNDSAFGRINHQALAVFRDAQPYEQALTKSFGYIRHYFPEITIPKVYFFVSGFNSAILYHPSFIGAGIDLYIDSDFPEYKEIAYDYMMPRMCPDNVLPDLLLAILLNNFPPRGELLIDKMLYRGKIMYLLQTFLPQAAPNQLIGYSKFQWEWSRKYESEIWKTLINNNDLFSSDNMTVRKYMDEAPFTATVSQDSPGRLGVWLGWQIVQNYMNKNQNITLADLMREQNSQTILDKAAYHP
jgi:hypothetical protein